MQAIPVANQIKPAAFTDKKYLVTLIFVTSLFMFWGVAITMGRRIETSTSSTY